MKKITYIKPIAFLITLFCVVNFSFGQVVAWEMNGNAGSEATVNASTIASNLNTSTLSRGIGLNVSTLGNAFSSTSFTNGGVQANAIANNEYLQFQVSASSGYQVSLSTLDATFRRSSTGPNTFIWRYSNDGVNFNDIGTPFSYTVNAGNGTAQAQIDLSTTPVLQNVVSGTTITFRLYGWGSTNTSGTFAIGRLAGNDLRLSGTITTLPCLTTTTWASGAWTNGLPNSLTKSVVINDNYNTSTGNIIACSLTVNSGLTVSDGTFVEVVNDVVVDGGTISVATEGSFVQNDSSGTFSIINSGNATVSKSTRNYVDAGLHYTYWSSPVTNASITTVFANPDDDRRYSFDGSNFLDEHTVGTTNGIPDDIDDNDNDWQIATGIMTPGYGYAVTASAPPSVPGPINYSDIANFYGVFNTGNIDITIYRNDTVLTDNNWNLIGNPYPSAISSDDFLTLNTYSASNPTGVLEGSIYFWTHISAASLSNSGNQVNNFSQDDYATLNLSGGTAANNGGAIPNRFIPSGQSFFATFSNVAPTTGGTSPVLSNTVRFNNSMRKADGSSNSQFFKNSNTKSKSTSIANRLWVDLTSDNGVFNQVLVAYINGATDSYDGMAYDAPKNLSAGASAIFYSNIEGNSKKFAIQGKSPSDLTESEIIPLGFKTSIDVATLYKLSIAQLEGDFLNSKHIYLKDNLLNKVHDLSTSDYTFTSEVGEFNDRFVVGFNANALLSTNDIVLDENTLSIVELDNDRVQFKLTNNLNIKTVSIYDLLGRQLYHFKGQNSKETFNLSKLRHAIYIAKVKLSNGVVISKKAIKK